MDTILLIHTHICIHKEIHGAVVTLNKTKIKTKICKHICRLLQSCANDECEDRSHVKIFTKKLKLLNINGCSHL